MPPAPTPARAPCAPRWHAAPNLPMSATGSLPPPVGIAPTATATSPSHRQTTPTISQRRTVEAA